MSPETGFTNRSNKSFHDECYESLIRHITMMGAFRRKALIAAERKRLADPEIQIVDRPVRVFLNSIHATIVSFNFPGMTPNLRYRELVVVDLC